jgi:hypothetical protein
MRSRREELTLEVLLLYSEHVLHVAAIRDEPLAVEVLLHLHCADCTPHQQEHRDAQDHDLPDLVQNGGREVCTNQSLADVGPPRGEAAKAALGGLSVGLDAAQPIDSVGGLAPHVEHEAGGKESGLVDEDKDYLERRRRKGKSFEELVW